MEKILFKGPILNGSVSTAMAKCGRKTCQCAKKKNPKLHGPYYRWTGFIEGKRTTVTLSEEEYKECIRRIENYKKFQVKLDRILEKAILAAPWNKS